MTIDLTPLLEALLLLLAMLALRYVLPWVRENTTAKQREDLLKWVDIAVAAAQQLFHQADGKIRLEYALDVLKGKGFDIDDMAVRDAVEAAVLKLHPGLGESE